MIFPKVKVVESKTGKLLGGFIKGILHYSEPYNENIDLETAKHRVCMNAKAEWERLEGLHETHRRAHRSKDIV